MEYLLSYLVYCWFTAVMVFIDSVSGDFPYRYDYTHGYYQCRPESYHEYAQFRRLRG